jgi:hypothetical protein
MSLRAISAELAAQGYLNENGRSFAAALIKSITQLMRIQTVKAANPLTRMRPTIASARPSAGTWPER